MPVLFSGLEPDSIAGLNHLDRPPFALSPATSSRHNEGLAEWVSVPCRSCAWLEGDDGAADSCWIGSLERLIDANYASEPVGRSLGR